MNERNNSPGDLSKVELGVFNEEFSKVQKNPTTGLFLTLALGAFGAHHFYMGKPGLGFTYLALSWTFMPLIFAVLEVFLIKKQILDYNRERSNQIVASIRSRRGEPAPTTSAAR